MPEEAGFSYLRNAPSLSFLNRSDHPLPMPGTSHGEKMLSAEVLVDTPLNTLGKSAAAAGAALPVCAPAALRETIAATATIAPLVITVAGTTRP